MGKFGKPLVSDDIPIEQRKDTVIPELGESMEHIESDIARPAGDYISASEQKYLSDLQFMEDPVKIIVHGSSDRVGFNCTDYVAVQGVPGEMLLNNKWIQVGYFPVEMPMTTKRKYLEVVLRSKVDKIRTEMNNNEQTGHTVNRIHRRTVSRNPVTLLEDKPEGREWFTRRTASNF